MEYRPGKADRTKAQLGEAVISLLAEMPPERVTADAIAERAGMGRATWFRHFSSKSEAATCALVAGCALASLPLLVVQGQEVHVGIWSLRRSLPPFALLTLAAFFGALEPAPEESGGSAATSGLWRRRAQGRLCWTLLLFVCSVASGVRTSAAALGGREAGALSLARAVEARMRETPGALFLFDRFG